MSRITEDFFSSVEKLDNKKSQNEQKTKNYFLFNKNNNKKSEESKKNDKNEYESNLEKNIKFFEYQKQKYLDDVDKIYELVIKNYKDDPNRSVILNNYDVENNFKTLLLENSEVWYEINEYLNYIKS